MKKLIFFLTVFCVFLQAGNVLGAVAQQDSPEQTTEKIAKKDSVSVDELDPVFYEPEAEEDLDAVSEGSNMLALYLIVAVVVIGAGVFFFLRSKKK